MLLGAFICFGFVNWKKYNYTTMLKKTVSKNALQRKESKLIWRPMINTEILSSSPDDLDGPRNWPIFIVPPLPITRCQTKSLQVESLSISQIRGCSNVLSWGGIIPPRNLLIIRDICMFHAQLHQKNSTSLPSKAFYFWFQVAMVIVRVITSMMVRVMAIAENNNNNNNSKYSKIKPFGRRRAPKNEQNATFWPLSPSWGNWLIYVIMYIWVSFCRTGKMCNQTWNLSKNWHDPIFRQKNFTHWKPINQDYFRQQ